MKHVVLWLVFCCCVMIQGHAQPVAQFDAKDKNIGMLLWKQPVTVYYQMTNTGNQPLVIERVVPSCACSEAEWTKEPIAPQKMGEISVVYDAKTLGHFYKDVAVYTNASEKPVYLAFRGEVATEVFEDANNYPYQIGSLRLSHSSIEFDDVNKGDTPMQEIHVMNNGEGPMQPHLMHLPPYLSATTKPEILEPGKGGTISVTLNSDKLRNLGLTQTSVYLARRLGEKVSKDSEIPVSVVLLPHLQDYDEFSKGLAPQLQMSSTDIDFTDFGGKKKKTVELQLSNVGKTTLKISSMQLFTTGLKVTLGKQELEPGLSTTLKVTGYADDLQKLRVKPRILMITNDPDHAKVVININVK